MGATVKILLFLGIAYFGYRYLTKPFRDYQKQMKHKAQNKQDKASQQSSKTDDIGEYIDFEEVNEEN